MVSPPICSPESLGFGRTLPSELHGGATVGEAAAIFDRVLAGKASREQIDCVAVNAAYAIRTATPAMPLSEALATARESIESGRAQATFRKFVELNS